MAKSVRQMRQAIALTLVLTLTACGGAPERPGGPVGQGPGGWSAQIDTSRLLNEGTRLRAAGQCREAIPYFHKLAMLGEGYGVAQHRLGLCLVDLGKDGLASNDFVEGLLWLRRAAASDYPEAQGDLARLYLEGPVDLRLPREAALWLALYENNPKRRLPAFVAMPADTLARLQAALNAEDREDGLRRAATWQPTIWDPQKLEPPQPAGGERPMGGPGSMGGGRGSPGGGMGGPGQGY